MTDIMQVLGAVRAASDTLGVTPYIMAGLIIGLVVGFVALVRSK
jgi:preprotein translocase subunit SecY